MTIYSLGKAEFYSTINLNIDYLSFALAGDELLIEAKVVRNGLSVINIEAFVYKRNKLLIKASSNVVNSGKKVFNTSG
jgi:acyl-coenzyme A thioesterase PaaI-like protein